MRNPKPRRAAGTQISPAIELLEARFLCAADDPTPLAFDIERFFSSDPSSFGTTSTQATPASAPSYVGTVRADSATGGQVDTFVLSPAGGGPPITVRLSWGTAPDLIGADLALLDAAGSTLTHLQIGQVSQLHAAFQPPWPTGDAGQEMHLDLSLRIWRNPAGSTILGYYDLALAWKPGPASDPIFLIPTGPGAGMVGYIPAWTIFPITAPQMPSAPDSLPGVVPGNEAGGGDEGSPLPFPGDSGGINQPPPAGGSTPAGSTPAGSLPPGQVFGPAIPPPVPGGGTAGPGPSPGSNPGATPGGVGGGHGPGAPPVPPPTRGRASADQGSALVVGPLPLGRSAPDGGIFERSFAATVGSQAYDPLTARASVEMAPSSNSSTTATGLSVVGRPILLRRPADEAPGSDRPAPGPVPPDLLLDLDLDEAPRGSIRLPPIRLAGPRPQPPAMPRAVVARSRPAARPLGLRGPWWSPVGATLIAASGTALLVLKLNAPRWARSPRG